MTRPTKNVDDLLNATLAEQPVQQEQEEAKPVEAVEAQEGIQTPVEQPEAGEDESGSEEITEETNGSKSPDKTDKAVDEAPDLDEYGNEVAKPRMYSEDDVQRMFRERFSRGQFNQQQQTQVQQAAKDFQPDPANPENWETQLEQFVEKTVDKIKTKESTRAWQEKEAEAQAEFQSKFETGMQKYKDFHETVKGLPITDAIMVAARDMKDPAAFIYAASKLHPEEIKRIANLPSAIQQAAEVGRLEERMKKAKNVTRASKPLTPTKGDMSVKYQPKKSIDQLINIHAKSKLRK